LLGSTRWAKKEKEKKQTRYAKLQATSGLAT